VRGVQSFGCYYWQGRRHVAYLDVEDVLAHAESGRKVTMGQFKDDFEVSLYCACKMVQLT